MALTAFTVTLSTVVAVWQAIWGSTGLAVVTAFVAVVTVPQLYRDLRAKRASQKGARPCDAPPPKT